MPHARHLTGVVTAAVISATVATGFGAPASAHEPGTPVLIDDINTTGASARFVSLRGVGDDLYFVADTDESGRELYFHDTSAGTTTLVDIAPGTASSYPQYMTAGPDGLLYFSADDGTHGRELWRADGATAQLVKDMVPGPEGSGARGFVSLNGVLYFIADDGTFSNVSAAGNELWLTDGTEAGTVMVPMNDAVTDVSPPFVYDGFIEDRLFFSGRGVTSNTGVELWRYTASSASVMEYDLRVGAPNSLPRYFAQAGTRLFFHADDELQRLDTPEAGPVWTSLPAVASPGPIVSDGTSTVWMPARASGDPTTFVLWSATGAAAPVEYPAAVEPAGIAMYASTPLYSARSANGTEFWASAMEYTDIVPGPDSGAPSGITPAPGYNRAVMWSFLNGLHRLGSIAGGGAGSPFQPYAELDPLPHWQFPIPLEPDPGGGGWWHIGNDHEHGMSIWHMTADTASTAPVPGTDLATGTGDSEAREFVPFGDGVMFVATDGATTVQPWLYDPATGTTTRLAGISPADDANYPENLAVSGDKVFFRTSRAAGDARGVWMSDGTAGGTRPVSDTGGAPTFANGDWQVPFKNGVLFDAETIDASRR